MYSDNDSCIRKEKRYTRVQKHRIHKIEDKTKKNPINRITRGKAIPLQAWSGPEGSRNLRFPDYMTTAQNGSKVVSLKHRPLLPPRKCSWFSFLLETESTPGS